MEFPNPNKPLCKTCKWFKGRSLMLHSNMPGEFDKCLNPALASDEEKAMTLIHGTKLKHRGYCSIERQFKSSCGYEARFYEPRR